VAASGSGEYPLPGIDLTELEHGASAITAVRAAFSVYDSILAGSDSPSSIVQLLVPALLSGKVSDVAASIGKTCHLVRAFVRQQALALAQTGIADVQRQVLGRGELQKQSGIEQIVRVRAAGTGAVIKRVKSLRYRFPAGRPEASIAMLPFCWSGEDDTDLAVDALLQSIHRD